MGEGVEGWGESRDDEEEEGGDIAAVAGGDEFEAPIGSAAELGGENASEEGDEVGVEKA